MYRTIRRVLLLRLQVCGGEGLIPATAISSVVCKKRSFSAVFPACYAAMMAMMAMMGYDGHTLFMEMSQFSVRCSCIATQQSDKPTLTASFVSLVRLFSDDV